MFVRVWLEAARITCDPQGDVIADMRDDPDVPALFVNIKEMRHYLHSKGARPEALAAVPGVWRRYTSWLKRHPFLVTASTEWRGRVWLNPPLIDLSRPAHEGRMADQADDEIDDEIDDEEIWAGICKAAAKRAGISAKQAQAILEDAGYHAYGHIGIVEAIEVVLWQKPRRAG